MEDLKKVGWRVETWYGLMTLSAGAVPAGDKVRYFPSENQARLAHGDERGSCSACSDAVVEAVHVLTKDDKTGWTLRGEVIEIEDEENRLAARKAEALKKIGTVLTAEECQLLGLPFLR
ncbi:MAG: hypothetical protein PHD72_01225 [Patescibacteria group bacterium]|nr:hypothetical protein [Patescibacteria group bacterium]